MMPYTVSSLSARPYTTRATFPLIKRLARGPLLPLPFGARFQRCVDGTATQINVIYIRVDFLKSAKLLRDLLPYLSRLGTLWL